MTTKFVQCLIDDEYAKANKRDCECVFRIANAVKDAGGTAYLVGGWVRDRILGKNPKDMDLEIHGITPDILQSILVDVSGSEVQKKGASFGVYGIKSFDFDIAMPRTEHCVGVKHTDFEVAIDPFMGVEEASKRRDFTINALMYDIVAHEVIDCHGGMDDMSKKIIRHVNDVTFCEDALRVFRAAQFAARFGFIIADETINIARKMQDVLSELSAERIHEELKKAMLKSETPSVFFNMLKEMNALQYWFPELNALLSTKQEPTHHPEGTAYVHTLMVIDEASKMKLNVTSSFPFMVSALCHDYGKAITTEYNEVKNKITSYGHDLKGVKLAEHFLDRLRFSNKDKKYVMNMVEMHMRPNMLAKQTKKASKFNKMFDASISPDDLICLAKADSEGRALKVDYSILECILRTRLEEYRALMKQPMVVGQDLLDMGMMPGKNFGVIMKRAHDLHLSGVKKDIVLKTLLKEWHSK